MTYAEGVDDAAHFLNVTRGLVKYGFSDEEIRGILGGNLLRLLEAVHESRTGPAPKEYAIPETPGVLTGGTTPL
jgi:hypothetical protein